MGLHSPTDSGHLKEQQGGGRMESVKGITSDSTPQPHIKITNKYKTTQINDLSQPNNSVNIITAVNSVRDVNITCNISL